MISVQVCDMVFCKDALLAMGRYLLADAVLMPAITRVDFFSYQGQLRRLLKTMYFASWVRREINHV